VAMKTAEAKLDWLGQKSDWLKAALRAADARIEAAAAKVELEKARVAKQKGIKTRDDQSVGSFESQWEDKTSDFQSARDAAGEEEKKAKDLEQKWQNLRTQHDKLKGT
jgi:phage shock protein A